MQLALSQRITLRITCVLTIAVAIVAHTATQGAPLPIGPDPWLVPVEVKSSPTQDDYYDFAWRTFIAINWPSLSGGDRGQPDSNRGLGSGPVVWEGYKQPSEVFLAGGGAPAEWSVPEPPPPNGCAAASPITASRWFDMSVPSSPFADYCDLDQAGSRPPYKFGNAYNVQLPTGPLIDRYGKYVLYEIRFNRSEFEYIKHFKYFDADNQVSQTSCVWMIIERRQGMKSAN